MNCSVQTCGSRPRIAIIAAMTRDMVIGSNNELPWHIPDDLKLFRRLTMGHPILMGRKTFDAIGQPLPGRENLVLSKNNLQSKHIHVFSNFTDALSAAAQFDHTLFVIGGATLYRMALPVADEMHISWIKKTYQGDVFFPRFSETDWAVVESRSYRDFCYKKYCRKEKSS